MAAEDLLVHDGGDRETVETVREGLPQLDVVPPLTYEDNHYISIRLLVAGCGFTSSETVRMRIANYLLTFIVKSVDSVDGGTLVVAAE